MRVRVRVRARVSGKFRVRLPPAPCVPSVWSAVAGIEAGSAAPPVAAEATDAEATRAAAVARAAAT